MESPDPRVDTPSSNITIEDIERLHHLLTKDDAPWWKNYPLLIAAAGFALSLVTSAASTYTSYKRDIHDQQAQLETTVQAIQELLLKQADLNAHYDGGPFQSEVLKLIVSQENTFLHTGASLASRLGTAATTSELISIAEGLWGVGDFTKAETLLNLAVEAAENANDKANALKNLGWFRIRTGTGVGRKDGDALYDRALHLEKEYDLHLNPNAILTLKVSGIFNWADALALVDCNAARSHFTDGETILLSAPNTPDLAPLRSQDNIFWQKGIGGIAACTPISTTTPKTPR